MLRATAPIGLLVCCSVRHARVVFAPVATTHLHGWGPAMGCCWVAVRYGVQPPRSVELFADHTTARRAVAVHCRLLLLFS